MRLLKLLVGIAIFGCSISAMEQRTDYSRYAKTYLQYVNPAVQVQEGLSAKEAFEVVCKAMPESGVGHTHIQGTSYGNSFTLKNQAPIDYVSDLLTGKNKSWSKDAIQQIDINIADAGCGLGLSAFSIIKQIVRVYENEQWKLNSPIKFDLFDILQGHQEALQALVSLVNATYPQYCKVTAAVHDVTQPFNKKNTYNIVLALNLMHYVPEAKWGNSLKNLEDAMGNNGMLFVTTDSYNSYLRNDIMQNPLLMYINPSIMNQITNQELILKDALKTSSPFLNLTLTIFDKNVGSYKGTWVLNLKAISSLKENVENIPGRDYEFGDLKPELLEEILRIHAAARSKNTIFLRHRQKVNGEEVPLQEIVRLLQEGQLAVTAGNYSFDEDTLTKAIESSYKSNLKKINLNWTKKLLQTPDGCYTTVGLTFRKSVQ